jgi:hypothetical protein
MPDPELGERVCVYAVLTPGATLTLDAVRAAMTSAHVARYKWPEHLVVVPELPATKVGKIDKKALRADIAARQARGWPAAGSGRPAPAKTSHPRSSGGNQGDQPEERNDQRRFRQP